MSLPARAAWATSLRMTQAPASSLAPSLAAPPAPCVDHLVVLASDLESGDAWCRLVLGVAPVAGGEHGFMGTHNRLLDISSPAYPRTYLEIIAVNPGARPTLAPGHRRWFDMDDEGLRARIARQGPQLIHWVACVPDIEAGARALAAMDLERGAIVAAHRGSLQWRITVRADGQRLLDGCLPTLIAWGDSHPCQSLPASGLQLQSLRLTHPEASLLARAGAALGLDALHQAEPGAARIEAVLSTPQGLVTVASRP